MGEPGMEKEQKIVICALEKTLISPRQAVRRRSVNCLSNLSKSMTPESLSSLMSYLMECLLVVKSDDHLRTIISLLGQICLSTSESTFHSPVGNKSNFPGYFKQLQSSFRTTLDIENDELRETCFSTLEAFVSCYPASVQPYIDEFLNIASRLLSYDPNYAADMEEEEGGQGEDQMSDVENDDEYSGEEEDEQYTDDDDLSWKVRRAASKFISCSLATYPNLSWQITGPLVNTVIARFSEREELVRVENLSTFKTFLQQYALQNGSTPNDDLRKGKRRRESDTEMAQNGSSIQTDSLVALLPKIHRALIKQLSGNATTATKQEVFEVVIEIVNTLQSGIENSLPQYLQAAETVMTTSTSASSFARQTGATATNLKLTVLSLLTTMVKRLSPEMVAVNFIKLVNPGSFGVKDKFYRIVFESLELFDELCLNYNDSLQVYRSIVSNSDRERFGAILSESLFRLGKDSALDQNVRDKLTLLLGHSLAMKDDFLNNEDYETELELLVSRLGPESTRMSAIKAVGDMIGMAKLPLKDSFINHVTEHLASYLRKSHRPLRLLSISTLEKLSANYQVQPSRELISGISHILDSDDAQLTAPACITLCHLIGKSPEVAQLVYSKIDRLLSIGAQHGSTKTLNAVIKLFAEMGTTNDSRDVIEKLLVHKHTYVELVGRCVAAVLDNNNNNNHNQYDTHSIKVFEEKAAKFNPEDENDGNLGLTVVGYYYESHPPDGELINSIANIIDLHPSNLYAPLALGRLASGDPSKFVPQILSKMASPARLAYLQALNEALKAPSSASALKENEVQIWSVLFDDATTNDDLSVSVAADIAGHLTIEMPGYAITQLENAMKLPSPGARKIVAQAVKIVMIDKSNISDSIVQPLLQKVPDLMNDSETDVRRVTLQLLSSMAHSKPEMIKPSLPVLLPLLYKETVQQKDLITVVDMGPFKHTIDNGLETRKVRLNYV